MQLLASSSHAPLCSRWEPTDLRDSRHYAHHSPYWLSVPRDSGSLMLGPAAMPVCQKRYLRTLLWTAILLSPSHPGFTKTPGFPRFNHCVNLCLSLTPLTDGPSASLALSVAWNTGNMGSGPHEDHAGLEVLCSHSFSSLSGEWRLKRARNRLHLVGPHRYGVQYGDNSARSGHGAPTICQHALTPQLQPFLARQPPLPLLTGCLPSPPEDSCGAVS